MLATTYITQELVPILDVTDPSTVIKRAKRENWKSQERQGQGGGYLWIVSSMPKDTQAEIANAVFKKRLSDDKLFTVNSSEIRNLPEEQQSFIIARASLVKFAEEYQRMVGKGVKKSFAEFVDLYNRQDFKNLTWIYEVVEDLSVRSIFRWRKDLEKGGLLALQDGRSNRAFNSSLMTKRVAGQIMADVFTFYKISTTEIHMGLKARYGKDLVPSLRSVQRFVRKFKDENKQLLEYIFNPDGWKNKYMSASGSRSEHITRVNQLWEMDSSPTDLLLSDGKRYTLLACIDVYSRRVMFHLARTSSALGICILLRKCLLAWGRPEAIKMDNGKDYKSFQVLNVLTSLHIVAEYCNPYSPEEKPHVERVFRTFQHGFVHRLKGFIGHNVAERKAIEGRKSFAQRRGMKRNEIINIELCYSIEEFQALSDDWSNYMYGERVHSSIRTSPNARAYAQADLVVGIADERALDILLAPLAGTRVVGKNGIRVFNGTYNALELGGREGTEVLVRLDEDNAGYIYVFNLEGEFICRAEDPRLTGVSRQELAMARKKHQQVIMAEKVKEVKELQKEHTVYDSADLVREVQKQKALAIQAERPIVDMPTVSTPDLDEAFKAARAHEVAKASPESAEEKQARAELEKEYAKSQKVAQYYLPTDITDRDSFYLAQLMEQKLAEKSKLAPEQTKWLASYQLSDYYAAWTDVYEEEGQSVFIGLDTVKIATGIL